MTEVAGGSLVWEVYLHMHRKGSVWDKIQISIVFIWRVYKNRHKMKVPRMIFVLSSGCFRVFLTCRWIFGPSDPNWHMAPKPQLLKNPLSHKPNASDSYSFIHPPSAFLFFLSFSLEAYKGCKCCLWFLCVCLVRRHACWRLALGVKRLSYDCKRVAGLSDGDLSSQPCRLSHIGSL